jgi:hypothetical protein
MANELKDLLDEMEERIEKLRIEYEQYFIGVVPAEPSRERGELAKIVHRLQSSAATNTALRFRTQSIISRFVTYGHYWTRIQRQIEAGTHVRELAKVKKSLQKKGIDLKGINRVRSPGELEAAIAAQLKVHEEAVAAGTPTGGDTQPALPALPPRPPGSPPPLPAAARAPASAAGSAPVTPPAAAALGAAETRLRSLYSAFLEARRRTGEPVEGVTFDRLVTSIQKQVAVIQQTTGCRAVDFKVEIKNGKAILKAVPRT